MSILPIARAMTRAELKAFRAAGLDPVFFDLTEESKTTFFKMTALGNDWILDHVYQGHDFDQVPNDQLLVLTEKTFKLTYGLEKEVKNC